MALSDAIKSALSSFEGSIDDRLKAYFNDQNGTSGVSLADAEHTWLETQTGITGATPDLWKKYLEDNGFSGALSDMLYALWNGGGPATGTIADGTATGFLMGGPFTYTGVS